MVDLKDEIAFLRKEQECTSEIGEKFRDREVGAVGSEEHFDLVREQSGAQVGLGVTAREEFFAGIGDEQNRFSVEYANDTAGISFESDRLFASLNEDSIGAALGNERIGSSLLFDLNAAQTNDLSLSAGSIRFDDVQLQFTERGVSVDGDLGGFITDILEKTGWSESELATRSHFIGQVSSILKDLEITPSLKDSEGTLNVRYTTKNGNGSIGYRVTSNPNLPHHTLSIDGKTELGTFAFNIPLTERNTSVKWGSNQYSIAENLGASAGVGYTVGEDPNVSGTLHVFGQPLISTTLAPEFQEIRLKFEKKY